MANININSYNEILGNMIRKIIADTPLSDINKGGVLLTLLEAAAANDFENNTAILNVLESLNIDAVRNSDLDAYASNFGLVRNTAAKASGTAIFTDSTITKRSTTLYPVKSAPIAGTSVLYVNDASEWTQTGSVYIGRGTANFEGPIDYTSITDNGTFYTINLASSLENDHLLSESVVDGQGTTNRLITAGTSVKIPANNITPEIEYVTLRDAVIPAGEVSVENVPIIAVKAGSSGNAGIRTITQLNTPPFPGATVTNTSAFINGRDSESDEDFRNRIKAYSSTLARGTKRSILSAIDGISDEDEGKHVASAVITEPSSLNEPSIVYVDDGSGFEPSFEGQTVDVLVNGATGSEEFLQLANFPLPRPQAINNEDAPYLLTDNMVLKVAVNEVEDSVTFVASDFSNIATASLSEIVVAINDRAELFSARLAEDSSRILIYPKKHDAETIKVVSDGGLLDANNILRFPVNEFSYIYLYRNNERLRETEKSAYVTSNIISTWDIDAAGSLIISVDDTPDQDRSFDIVDFGGADFASLTLSDWVNVFNTKYAGVTATATSTGRLTLTSNREGSASKIEIVGGTYLEKMFGGQEISSVGQDSDFTLNRQNGNLQLTESPNVGDIITAGSDDTRGEVVSNLTTTGVFGVSLDANSRPSEIVIVVDSTSVIPKTVNLAVGSTIVLSDEGSNIMRVTASTASAFREINAGDYIYITNRGDIDGTGAGTWVDTESCGLFKVSNKGGHTTDGVDTYIETINVNMVVGGPYSVQDSLDFQAFYSDVYPQLWRGDMTSNPASTPISDVVESLNDNIIGINAEIYNTGSIRITSVAESNGSIAIPVSVGNASIQLFETGGESLFGSPSHIASITQETDVVTMFERTNATNENVWLDRYTYTDIKGSITTAVEPNKDGTAVYSEELEDTAAAFETEVDYGNSISITTGQNKGQVRSVKSIIDDNNLGTRNDKPTTLMDYNVDDEYQVVKNLEFSSDDSLVAIVDKDASGKTIDVKFSRTCQVNDGSQGTIFNPTNLAFSADDTENEDGIDFGSVDVWGTLDSQTSTNFDDYAIWFKARNWYSSNGTDLIVRAKEFGPIGDKIRFNIAYPIAINQSPAVSHSSTPLGTLVTYSFGSDSASLTDVVLNDDFTFTDIGSGNFRITFPATATVTNINIGDIVHISPISGFSSPNTGTFKVNDKSDANRTIDIYNPNGVATVVGSTETQTIQTIADTAGSLDGSYFVVTAPTGETIKFWIDNGDSGTIEPAIGTTDESYEVTTINDGNDAVTVATAIAATLLNSPHIATATNLAGTSDEITFTFANNGSSVVGVDGSVPTNFSFAIDTAGVNDTYETIAIESGFVSYPINGTDSATIVSTVNESAVLELTEVNAGDINTSTYEETGALGDLSHEHNPAANDETKESVGLYDSINWVLTFDNANPNFQLKQPLILNGLSAAYEMDTAPNADGSVGEYFKLIPVTPKNVEHQLTHKALSQLNLVADVSISNDLSKIQIKSESLGSDGAIEIVGGRATDASFSIIGDSQSISATDGMNYLEVKIPAAPNTLSPGQYVTLENGIGAERLNRLSSSDTLDVVKINDEVFEYRYNAKTTNFNEFVEIEIVDANSVDPVSYPHPNIVWRWTHSDSGSSINLADNNVGTVGNQPLSYDSAGLLNNATNISIDINDSGSATTSLSFNVMAYGQPAQGDYVAFENQNGDTWAFYYDIDGALVPPTGASYLSAANQVTISILSSDSPNDIMNKTLSQLLLANISNDFDMTLLSGATLSNVVAGDIINPIGDLTGWPNSVKTFSTGDTVVGGHPIVNVDASSRYIDVVNPNGVAMSSTAIGSGELLIHASPSIEWRLSHSSNIEISSVSIVSGVATATTSTPHNLNVGDTFSIVDVIDEAAPSSLTVNSVIGENQFTYSTAQPDAAQIAPVGYIIADGKSNTKYQIESLGYNSFFRLRRKSGDSPMFKSCGVAIDDLIKISGTTFNTINAGYFRVVGVDEDSVIYRNDNAIEELNTISKFNNFNLAVNWVSNANIITGVEGAFANLSVGDWVKKTTDDDSQYRQVTAFNTGVAETATSISIGSGYGGVTSTTEGVGFNQVTGVNAGVELKNVNDIRFFEGDTVRVGDSLFISEDTRSAWFEPVNSGTFTITSWGTNSSDGRFYLRVNNLSGIAEQDVSQGLTGTRLSISESYDNRFSTIKQVSHVAIDSYNADRRIVFLSPGDRPWKWSQTNSTRISSLSKMNYSDNVITGTDGYIYYTGLLRKVQRTIDGFEPDQVSFPGRKAVGSLIEVLPPLPRKVSIAIDVTTNDGVNLSEISDEIKSTIINYIADLGVGEDVILSDIIVRVKSIMGIAAVTFIEPEPSEERISISSDEKAFINPDDISIA